MPRSKTDEAYWSTTWRNSALPQLAPRASDITADPVDGQLHLLVARALAEAVGPTTTVVEFGCARSVWLPYFAEEFGMQVTGIDYSEVGCAQARELLARAGVDGVVVCHDLFDPDPSLRARFDVGFSRGLVEHFPDTGECLRGLTAYLRPGGTLITVIPNMTGMHGWLQRLIDRRVYDLHVPLTREDLVRATIVAGLVPVTATYLVSVNFGVNNFNTIRPGTVGWYVRRVLLGGLNRLGMVVWALERRFGRLRPNRVSSPYVVVVARIPGDPLTP